MRDGKDGENLRWEVAVHPKSEVIKLSGMSRVCMSCIRVRVRAIVNNRA